LPSSKAPTLWQSTAAEAPSARCRSSRTTALLSGFACIRLPQEDRTSSRILRAFTTEAAHAPDGQLRVAAGSARVIALQNASTSSRLLRSLAMVRGRNGQFRTSSAGGAPSHVTGTPVTSESATLDATLRTLRTRLDRQRPIQPSAEGSPTKSLI